MQKASGLTLIELMIVIAIIAIIAAIAIPGLLQSQRASNERNASASLKTLCTSEVDFHGNDRDGNSIKDYWTRDVSGLYTVCPIGSSDPVRLIELSICGADANPLGAAANPAPASHVTNAYFTRPSPKASYWFLALTNDQDGSPYASTSNGAPPFDQPWFNLTRYAFMAFPDSTSGGRQIFLVNEDHVVLKRQLTGNVRPAGAIPPGNALLQSGAAGTAPILQWPTDTQMKADYAKLD